MTSAPVEPDLLSPIQPIERTRAAEAVRDQLLRLVESARYPVGSKLLSEHELARSFRVSRPVVREALGSLRSVGLIVSRTGSGVTELRELQSELSLTMARMAGGLDAPFDEHSAIVDAIARKDPEGARAAMRDHLRAIQERSQRLGDRAGGRDAG